MSKYNFDYFSDNSTKKTDVIFDVWGGLGNQLFDFAAGAYFFQMSKKKLALNMKSAHKGILQHGGSIENLTLPCGEYISREFVGFRVRFERKLSRDFGSFLPGFILRKLNFYESFTNGFDKNLTKLKQVYNVRGYFQTRRYVEELKLIGVDLSSEIDLRVKRAHYLKLEKYYLQNNGCAIHFRRGDYSTRRDSLGLLGKEYYLKAMEFVSLKNSSESFIIFTDDKTVAQQFFDKTFNKFNITFLSSDNNLSPEETMILLSKFEKIIIANSSFSWWAATLGSKSKEVVSPKIWFKGLRTPQDLIHLNWVCFDPDWEP